MVSECENADELKPFFSHDDGSMVLMEEVEEILKTMPITEDQGPLQEILLDCTIEEYMRRNGCVFADDFDNECDEMYWNGV